MRNGEASAEELHQRAVVFDGHDDREAVAAMLGGSRPRVFRKAAGEDVWSRG